MEDKYIKALGEQDLHYVDLVQYCQDKGLELEKLPFVSRVFLENMLRAKAGGAVVSDEQIKSLWKSTPEHSSVDEVLYSPARVLMQDFTGVPAMVDLAALRDAAKKQGKDPKSINPVCPVDLVIDHSVAIDSFAKSDSLAQNMKLEFERNQERYVFLKWAQKAFDNVRIIPPGMGICHQINVEYLASVGFQKKEQGKKFIVPDTCVGTDSHTTMVNGVGVLGWGVGGLEAEAVMLGQSLSLTVPSTVGVKLEGKLKNGVTATDLVLRITEMLREVGVVGRYVEFYGPGVQELALPNRLTISNMAPEYGATCGFFPVDQQTLDFLDLTGRDSSTVRKYLEKAGLYQNYQGQAEYDIEAKLDLATVEPSLAGPKRPQDRIPLGNVSDAVKKELPPAFSGRDESKVVNHGDVVIAAITSCTNTSNPFLLIAAGLMAKNAREKGLSVKPWVKTSFAPGSRVAAAYLQKLGLLEHLEALGFNIAAYGCTTCIGNSGPLPENVAQAIDAEDLMVGAVLSGNRNFEGRIHQQVKLNFLASPPLVLAYALFGKLSEDINSEALGQGKDGKPVYLKDIFPDDQVVLEMQNKALSSGLFNETYAHVFDGTKEWQELNVPQGELFEFNPKSTYLRLPPFLEMDKQYIDTLYQGKELSGAQLLFYGPDSVTTDHISPAGGIKPDSPAGKYLQENNVQRSDFNSYGSRRGDHEVMMRGTFANIRLKNRLVDKEGGNTLHIPSGTEMPIFDAAMRYINDKTPLVILAGKEYGTGSSRDWAAKGTRLQGVCAVIAQTFERIHRSNLAAMAVLPLELGSNTELPLSTEQARQIKSISVAPPSAGLSPRCRVEILFELKDGSSVKSTATCRLDTATEIEWFKMGGIMPAFMQK